jgi:ankyrin repeat protein
MTRHKLDPISEIVLNGQAATLLRHLLKTPALATKQFETEFLVEEIPHQFYTGDTLLHFAAAALRPDAAAVLVKAGAVVGATNRRGAQPIHYACDARPAHKNVWNPAAQAKLIRFLVAEGADANSADGSGITPLHRAVRARGATAVQALLCAGANPKACSGRNGSTPLHLAVTSTGASGTAGQTEIQAEIVRQLLAAGASLSDVDGRDHAVIDQIKSAALRQSLARIGIFSES